MENLRYWIWLSILGLEPNEKIELLKKYKNPEIIYNLKDRELPDKIKKEISDTYKRNIIDKKIEELKKNKIKILTIYDEKFPKRLKNIYACPIVLYAKGNIDLLNEKYTVGMVGCRDCSSYGQKVALRLSYELSKYGVVIISGMARGIDRFSHIRSIK